MGVKLIKPDSIVPGWQYRGKYFGIAVWLHNLQCDRRWVFGIRFGRSRVLGYLTRGDSEKGDMSYSEAGWFFFKSQCIAGLKV